MYVCMFACTFPYTTTLLHNTKQLAYMQTVKKDKHNTHNNATCVYLNGQMDKHNTNKNAACVYSNSQKG